MTNSSLASSIFYTEISIPYHALVVDSIILLRYFTPTVVARLKIWKRLIFKKLLSLPAPFQHFRFRVRFRFQPLSSKYFHFHKKLTASSFRFRFHIPGLWLVYCDRFSQQYGSPSAESLATCILLKEFSLKSSNWNRFPIAKLVLQKSWCCFHF